MAKDNLTIFQRLNRVVNPNYVVTQKQTNQHQGQSPRTLAHEGYLTGAAVRRHTATSPAAPTVASNRNAAAGDDGGAKATCTMVGRSAWAALMRVFSPSRMAMTRTMSLMA